MRTQGILLVKDAILLLRALLAYRSVAHLSQFRLESNLMAADVKLGPWRQSCHRALASLEELSQRPLENVKRAREYGDKGGADVISSSSITCLEHLAILYEAVCQTNPAAEEINGLCDLVLQPLGVLTSELSHLDEYTHLDLLLGVRPCLWFPGNGGSTGYCDRTLGTNRYRCSTSA